MEGRRIAISLIFIASRLRSMKVPWVALSASTELATPVLDELGDFPAEIFEP